MATVTYAQHKARIDRFFEGQDELYYQGHRVTPKFDMVIDGRRVRPKLETLQVGNCVYTRVKRHGKHCGNQVTWTPKMYISPLCGCC